MEEKEIHKCCLSYGYFSILLLIRELEEEENYLACSYLLRGLKSFIEKYAFLCETWETRYSEELEKNYYKAFKDLVPNGKGGKIAKQNMSYYLKDIKKRLGI